MINVQKSHSNTENQVTVHLYLSAFEKDKKLNHTRFFFFFGTWKMQFVEHDVYVKTWNVWTKRPQPLAFWKRYTFPCSWNPLQFHIFINLVRVQVVCENWRKQSKSIKSWKRKYLFSFLQYLISNFGLIQVGKWENSKKLNKFNA